MNIAFIFFFFVVLTSNFGASSGARCDAVLACSASKDFCKDSLTFNDEIGQRRFHRYSRVLSPQPRIIEQSSTLNLMLTSLKLIAYVKYEGEFHIEWNISIGRVCHHR